MLELHTLMPLLDSSKTVALIKAGTSGDDDENLLQRFHGLLMDYPGCTDDEAAKMLYGDGYDASHKPYQKLKHKFKYLLLNLVLLMDNLQPDYTNWKSARITIQRELSVAKILALQSSTKGLSISLLEKVYKRSVQFEMTDACEESARYLVNLLIGVGQIIKKEATIRKNIICTGKRM